MPTPRHPRHLPATLSPSPYHPRPHPNSSAYSTRSPRSTGSPYSTATYAPHHALPPPLHTPPLYMYLVLISSRTFSPRTQQPSPPFRTAPHPSSAEKFALPRLKQAVTHLWKSFVPKEEEDLSSTSYPADIMWITLRIAMCIANRTLDL